MKPTQQEIIELAREAGFGIGQGISAIRINGYADDLLRLAELLLERFGAGGGEPVARLMKWAGKGAYPKKGYTVARTYEECPKDAYPNDWEEGPELHTHPSPTDPKAEYERGLEDALSAAVDAVAFTGGAVDTEARVRFAIEALKGKQ